MSDEDKEAAIKAAIQKDLVKEALQEWMDKQFATFGRWTFNGLMSAAFAGLVYLWLSSHGWVK